MTVGTMTDRARIGTYVVVVFDTQNAGSGAIRSRKRPDVMRGPADLLPAVLHGIRVGVGNPDAMFLGLLVPVAGDTACPPPRPVPSRPRCRRGL
jgi:hypothetical protein